MDAQRREIKPMWDVKDKISRLHKMAIISNGWIYPPLVEVEQNSSEKKCSGIKPQLPAKFFTVEPTHTITIHPNDDEKLRFLILSFGFLKGIYLSPAEYLCLHRVPYEIGKLTGYNDIKLEA